MKYKEYNRLQAIEYAKKWAFSRNPRYYNFDPVGGDCTSFASQCIYSRKQKNELYERYRMVLYKWK